MSDTYSDLLIHDEGTSVQRDWVSRTFSRMDKRSMRSTILLLLAASLGCGIIPYTICLMRLVSYGP